MKSDSRAFSVKCPTPSKSTATKFLLHNLRSCRHPCNAASAGVHPDRSCLRFFSAADYVFAAAFYLLTNTTRVGAFIYVSPYRARASRRRLPSSAEEGSRRTHPPAYLRQHRPSLITHLSK